MRRNWLVGSVVTAIGALFVSVGVVQAEFDEGMIDVSFGGRDATPVGMAVAGSEGDKWNAPEGHQGKSIALFDVTGAKTDVRLTFDADRTWDAVSDSPFLGGPCEKLLRHYLVAEREFDVALTGLTPGVRYSLLLYSASNRNDRQTKFTVGEQTRSTTFSTEKLELAAGVNYTHFVVTADKDGNLTIVYSGGEGSEGNLNGLQIAPATEADVAAAKAIPENRAMAPVPKPAEQPRVVEAKPPVKKITPNRTHRGSLLATSRLSGEWGGWRGPNRDGKSPDTGLLEQWPDSGPELLWQVGSVGPGYASAVVSNNTVYTTGDVDNKLMISAINMDGTLKWQTEAAPAGPAGSRSTPTIEGDSIYLLAANGLIGCYDARDGEKKWSHEAKEYGGSPGVWAYAESVLIYKNMAIFKPGGKNCIVALDKTNGETIWASSGFDAGPEYGSCIVVTFQGQPMIVTGTRQGIIAVDPTTGKLLWSNDFSANNTANCPTPAYEDGYVFWANGYGKGGICLKLGKDGDKITTDVAWTTKDMDCHHGGFIIHEGYIYGNHSVGWVCLDLRTGEKQWNERAVGKGSLCFADGMLYLFSEKDGQAALADCSPAGLELHGKVKVEGSGPSWAHPVVVGGRLYLRYDTNLYCYDVARAETASAANTTILGPNVYVFDTSMSDKEVQNTATSVFAKMESNQFGSERYALLFKPGDYDVDFNVGFYTHVAGLGQNPDDVNINGGVNVNAQWMPGANATCNFWRTLENLAITPSSSKGVARIAVSQAVPLRRLHVKGSLHLFDFDANWNAGWASGGFLADSVVDGEVVPASQQQWLSRNSKWDRWSNGVWNMVFVGCENAPSGDFPDPPYTVVNQTPVIREKPYLYVDNADQYFVFIPSLQTDRQGVSWGTGSTPGKSVSIDQFYIAQPSTANAASINAALEQGKHLLFTPGIYLLDHTLKVTNADTMILGLGVPSLVPTGGLPVISVADVDGVTIAGLILDAGPVNSASILEVGSTGSDVDHSANPTFLYDLTVRTGGATTGKNDVGITINGNNVVADQIWIWRADHGEGAAWTTNPTKNGLVVNGDNVTIYGLFNEHHEEYQTLWNGNGGRVYFYQSEMPYDVPNQSSWMSGETSGYASYKVADGVTSHEAWGIGVYCYFRDAAVKANNAIEAPAVDGVRFHNLTTVWLNGTTGSEITHIINNSGGRVYANSPADAMRQTQ